MSLIWTELDRKWTDVTAVQKWTETDHIGPLPIHYRSTSFALSEILPRPPPQEASGMALRRARRAQGGPTESYQQVVITCFSEFLPPWSR